MKCWEKFDCEHWSICYQYINRNKKTNSNYFCGRYCWYDKDKSCKKHPYGYTTSMTYEEVCKHCDMCKICPEKATYKRFQIQIPISSN